MSAITRQSALDANAQVTQIASQANQTQQVTSSAIEQLAQQLTADGYDVSNPNNTALAGTLNDLQGMAQGTDSEASASSNNEWASDMAALSTELAAMTPGDVDTTTINLGSAPTMDSLQPLQSALKAFADNANSGVNKTGAVLVQPLLGAIQNSGLSADQQAKLMNIAQNMANDIGVDDNGSSFRAEQQNFQNALAGFVSGASN